MGRPHDDLEETHEPPGALTANAELNAEEKRNEVNKIALYECRDREAAILQAINMQLAWRGQSFGDDYIPATGHLTSVKPD